MTVTINGHSWTTRHLHRLISALGEGPVDIFGSSGGASDGLALVARHPEQVRTLVAHEPPLASTLPDRDAALAAAGSVQATYEREGMGPAMAKFLVLAGLKGPIPPDFADQPAPDPADFRLPASDDGSRDDPLLGSASLHSPSPARSLGRSATGSAPPSARSAASATAWPGGRSYSPTRSTPSSRPPPA